MECCRGTSTAASGACGGRRGGPRLYVVGGVGPDAQTTLAYDPQVDRWAPRAALPAPTEHLAVAAYEDALYAVGGRQGTRNLDLMAAYDTAEDRWRALPSLPTPRSGLAAAMLDGEIYVAGGETLDGSGRTF